MGKPVQQGEAAADGLEELDDGPEAVAGAAADGVLTLDEEAGGEGEAELPKRAVEQADGSVVLPLLHPVTLRYRSQRSGQEREERCEQLHLRRLTGADMRAITAASQETAPVVAIGRSARQNPVIFGKIFDLMDGRDVADAGKIIERFLGNGR